MPLHSVLLMTSPGDDHVEFLGSDFAKRMMSEEPLHPDLVPYLDTETDSLRHPLVYQVFGMRPGVANYIYEQKKKGIARAIKAKDWHSYVFLHERPYRTDALLQVMDLHGALADEVKDLSVKEVAELVASVWTDSENIWQNTDEWAQIWGFLQSTSIPSGKTVIPGWVRRLMLNEEDAQVFDALPEHFTIYRGATRGLNDLGWSWTLDHQQAVWFARRWAIHGDRQQEPVVVHGVVAKEKVLAYFDADHRGEKEIVVNPDDVVTIRWERVDTK